MDPATYSRVDGVTLFEDVFGKQTTVSQYESTLDAGHYLNLIPGAPNPDNLKTAMSFMEKAAQHLFASEYAAQGNILQYGPNLGSARYRSELAKFLSAEYKDEVLPKNVMVTSGASSGLLLVSSLVFSPGSIVFVEDPTYFIAINMIRKDLDMTIVPVPTDEDGMRVDVLEKIMEERFGGRKPQLSDHRPFQCMIYTVPTYNNPRGSCLAPDRCRKLIQIARQYEALIFCDDVYNMLHYEGKECAPPRLLTYDNPSDPDYKGHVVSNGTFSKILGPGMRLGWIEAGDRLMELFFNFHAIHSGGSANHFSSEILAEALSLGLEQNHLKNLRSEYTKNVKSICDLLKSKLPGGVQFSELKGGYFFWLEMPANCSGERVAEIARDKYKVIVMPGSRCSATGSFKNCIRISFTFNEIGVLLVAVERVCQAIQEHMDEIAQ